MTLIGATARYAAGMRGPLIPRRTDRGLTLRRDRPGRRGPVHIIGDLKPLFPKTQFVTTVCLLIKEKGYAGRFRTLSKHSARLGNNAAKTKSPRSSGMLGAVGASGNGVIVNVSSEARAGGGGIALRLH